MESRPTVYIADRSASCVTSKRSSQHCRLTLSHTAPRATACITCQERNATVDDCRVKLRHSGASSSASVPYTDELKAQNGPQCFQQLKSLSLSKDSKGIVTYTGYMRDYSPTKWEEWLSTYSLQTNNKFIANRGPRTGKAGIVEIDGKMMR